MTPYELILEHRRLTPAEFWWLQADEASVEMDHAENRLSYVWARDREREAIWKAVIGKPKPGIASIWMPEGVVVYETR